MPLSTRRSSFVFAIALTFLIALLLVSLHPSVTPYTQLKPIQDYFSRPPPPLATCPSAHDKGRTPLVHETQTCYPVPSNHHSFALEVCYTPDSCNQFTARIARTSHLECQEAEDTPDPSEDAALTRWMREERGPDTFYLRTDGAERYASVYSTYNGQCSYSFDVRLKNPGDTYLQIWWTEERYTGFSETNASWPAMLLDPISEPIHLKTCPSHCEMQISTPLAPSHKLVSIPPTPAPHTTLPNCTGSEPIHGSYLPAHPMDVLYPPEVLPQPFEKPVVGRYNFVPESCAWRHAGLRFGDPGRCTARPAKMFITGDSHGRVAYDAMLHRLEGRTDILLHSEKVGSKSAIVDQLDINFIWDPRGSEFLVTQDACTERVKDSNVIIISTVAHYDDSTTAYLLAETYKILTAIAACPYTPTPDFPVRKHILLYAPAAVQRQDEFVIKFKDHGTNLRMHYWRDEVHKVARKLDWEFVDQFELTLPHSLEPLATDMAHFLANDALDPIVDELLGKTGLCD